MRTLALTLIAFFSITVAAQNAGEEKVYQTAIYFNRHSSNMSRDYQKNDSTLTNLLTFIKTINDDPATIISDVKIEGTASPEGNEKINTRLSMERAKEIEKLILKTYDEKVPTMVSSRTYSWDELYQSFESAGYSNTGKIKSIVESAYAQSSDDNIRSANIIKQFKALNGGKEWTYIDNTLMPKLRTTIVTITRKATEKSIARMAEPAIEPEYPSTQYIQPAKLNTIEVAQQEPQTEKSGFKTYTGISTNLLYDAMLVPNIGVVFDVGRHVSIGGNWMYAWWKTDKSHYYWRVYGGDINVQKWLSRTDKPFSGHHIGGYAQIITYDFELGNHGYLGNRWSYGGGVTYGYSWPIKRRLRIDANINLGYIHGTYKKYEPKEELYIREFTKTLNYVGPTQVQVSLVWLLDKTPCWRTNK